MCCMFGVWVPLYIVSKCTLAVHSCIHWWCKLHAFDTKRAACSLNVYTELLILTVCVRCICLYSIFNRACREWVVRCLNEQVNTNCRQNNRGIGCIIRLCETSCMGNTVVGVRIVASFLYIECSEGIRNLLHARCVTLKGVRCVRSYIYTSNWIVMHLMILQVAPAANGKR